MQAGEKVTAEMIARQFRPRKPGSGPRPSPVPLLWQARNDIGLLREAAQLAARKARRMGRAQRSSVYTRLASLSPLLRFGGDEAMEGLLVRQLRRDFPRPELVRIREWPTQGQPDEDEFVLWSVDLLAAHLYLLQCVGTRRCMNEVKRIRKHFADCADCGHPSLGRLQPRQRGSPLTARDVVRSLTAPKGGAQQGRGTVWRVRNDPDTGRAAARLVVRQMAGLNTPMKCKVGGRLASRFPLLWCYGYEELGKLLIARLRTDFPRDRLDRIEEWAKVEKPRPVRHLAISARWLNTLVTLIERVGTKQSLKVVNRIKRRFSHCKYPLMRFEIQ